MNATHALTCLWTPWSIAAAVVALLVAVGLSFWSWQRSGFQFAQGCLELLRLAIIGLCALMFNQPEWIEAYQPEEVPTVAVFVDNSPSMETRDVAVSSPSGEFITRREARFPGDHGYWMTLNAR
jgi:hypothetical protein